MGRREFRFTVLIYSYINVINIQVFFVFRDAFFFLKRNLQASTFLHIPK